MGVGQKAVNEPIMRFDIDQLANQCFQLKNQLHGQIGTCQSVYTNKQALDLLDYGDGGHHQLQAFSVRVVSLVQVWKFA